MSALGAASCSNSKVKILLINIAVVFFTLSAFEAYLGKDLKKRGTVKFNPKGFHKLDDVLGYRLEKNYRGKVKKIRGSEVIFDVTYTTDSIGMRISPPSKKIKNQPCILFFGGSYTFGAGVNDQETMPYRVGVRTGESFRVFNFGVGAYGPHQMLSAIERGLVKNAIQCAPKHIFYQGIWDHVRRSAGRALWTHPGPQYAVGKQGEAIYSGMFDPDKLWPGQITKLLYKSFIYSKIFRYKRANSRNNFLLFHAIVRKARDLLKVHYPQALFHIIYWDKKDRFAGDKKLVDRFKRDQIPVHLISNILPGFHFNPAIYKIRLPYEEHPNAQAHDLIAQYIAENILIIKP